MKDHQREMENLIKASGVRLKSPELRPTQVAKLGGYKWENDGTPPYDLFTNATKETKPCMKSRE